MKKQFAEEKTSQREPGFPGDKDISLSTLRGARWTGLGGKESVSGGFSFQRKTVETLPVPTLLQKDLGKVTQIRVFTAVWSEKKPPQCQQRTHCTNQGPSPDGGIFTRFNRKKKGKQGRPEWTGSKTHHDLLTRKKKVLGHHATKSI